ncbi:MAG: Ni/Fe-hydrogenase cytochrome b subunit [Phycisphaerales bacterium]|nr:MAG: Ni/Fe-hydrogenase cytochrome b subunit [Phycisphaerales bacterium]
MTAHSPPAPVNRKLLTPGVYGLLGLIIIGLIFGAYRFFFGLRASTNLNQYYPWGIWIVADVSFIALAAGGFTTAAIAHIFHRSHYHLLARPALVLALLGYTSACVVLAADLGKYYNIWHPLLPRCWQGNSALYEVGMCVMCYLIVLYVEFLPVVCEYFMNSDRRPRLKAICATVYRIAERTMFLFIILGVGISCLHQSSLGNVMVLAADRLHPLWQTPILSLLFLISAAAVGFPTVIFMAIYGAWALRLQPRMHVIGPLARYIPILLGFYLAFKLGDMLIRRSYVHLAELSLQNASFLIEIGLGLVAPILMTLSRRVRRSPQWLCVATALTMFGVVLNRANVYWIGYRPLYTDTMYFPSLAEWGVTVGAVAGMLFCWRAIVTYLPVVSLPHQTRTA